jgi:hypothetical protein
MELNEIKKDLYRNNPVAVLGFIRKGVAYYFSRKGYPDEVKFEVPVNDMGDADFFNEMDSKHLIRWIV